MKWVSFKSHCRNPWPWFLGIFTRIFFLVLFAAPSMLLLQSCGQVVALDEARRLNAQAISLSNAKKFSEAATLFQRSLAIREKVLGPYHLDVATSLDNLAWAYGNQDQYAQADTLHRRALAIREKILGSEHQDVADSLLYLGSLHVKLGQYNEAEPLLKRLLAMREKLLGPHHIDVAASLELLASVFRLQDKYAQAEALYHRALAIREKILGPDHPDLANTLLFLATVHTKLGQYAQAEPLLKRLLAIREKILGPEHPEVAASLNNLAELYRAQHRYAEGESFYTRALTLRERVLGPEHPDVTISLDGLAALYGAQGRYAEAEPLAKRSLGIWEKALGPEHHNVAIVLHNLAQLYRAQGRYAEEESLYRRSLAIREKLFGPEHLDVAEILAELFGLYAAQGRYAEAEPLYKRSLAIWEKALGPEDPRVAVYLEGLARFYIHQRRYGEAELLYRRSLAIVEKKLRPDHPNVAIILHNLAQLYRAQGRYAEAEPLFRRAMEIGEKILAPEYTVVDVDIGFLLDTLAGFYRDHGRYGEAEPLLRRSLRIVEEKLGPENRNVAVAVSNLALIYRDQRRYAEAEPLYRRSLAIRETLFGLVHPRVVESLNDLAYILAEQQQHVQARALYERARRIILAVGRINIDLDEDELRGLLKKQHEGIQAYAKLLASIARNPKLDTSPGSASTDAFVITQQIRSGAAHAALARAGARSASEDLTTGALARQVQDLRNQRQAMGKFLIEEYGRPTAHRNQQKLETLQKETQRLDKELTEAVNRLNKAFPKYAELSSPDPIDVESVKKVLRSDEALVSYFTLNDQLLVWLVRRGKEVVYRDIEIKKADLEKLVARVRLSLDQSGNPDMATGKLLPFDVSGSHELFKLLLGPIREHLVGLKHLLIVPDETLLPLPFGALITQAQGEPYRTLADIYEKKQSPSAAELTSYAKLSWLAKEYAVTVLPSATSLRALRQIPRVREKETEPLIAFGDPVLQGRGTQRGGVMLASRGTRVAIEEIRRFDRLPGTRDELMAVANALGANPAKALYLDKQATKPTVMKLNASGRLGKAQVVSFATHGLIGGEVTGLKEPALVLTPPDKPSEQDDGLLGLEDILSLKLNNADWVILSACNTAAPGGSGEGLSGLVRAFFFAGAPSLLVSHWSVDDRATQALMTEVFQRYAKDKTMPRAEALRQGMLALMEKAKGDTAYFAHPYAWAPFFLVGEGAGAAN